MQGGTFLNDAVLRAMEQYIGREVMRAPYPGIMGAIGTALLTKERFQAGDGRRTFMGLGLLDDFSYTQEANSPCPFCGNHCKRTIIVFPTATPGSPTNRCGAGRDSGRSERRKGRKQLMEKKKRKGERAEPFLRCGSSC